MVVAVTSDRWKLILAATLAALALIAIALLGEREHVDTLLHWTGEQGALAPLILVVAYIVAAVLVVPALLISMCAGYLLGVTSGVITASIGSTLGAVAAFLVGRWLLRVRVRKAMAQRARFGQLERDVARDGFKIVLLSRLSPVLPSNVLNYALGVTAVRLRDFALASWLGMFPITLAYVYIGSTLASLAGLEQNDRPMQAWHVVLYVVGLLSTVAVVALLARLARQAIRSGFPRDVPPEMEQTAVESP